MRLLFDHNLSPRLVQRLVDEFPDAQHVLQLGLDMATDEEIWRFAGSHDFIIVTKDADFPDLLTLRGAPPKVVWIRRGNCSTNEIEALIRQNLESILSLARHPEEGVLVLL